jgi:hypothetical protein
MSEVHYASLFGTTALLLSGTSGLSPRLTPHRRAHF